jgi:hypothetical protein
MNRRTSYRLPFGSVQLPEGGAAREAEEEAHRARKSVRRSPRSRDQIQFQMCGGGRRILRKSSGQI